MEKTLHNLSQVALFFVLVFGGLHLLASLLIAEQVSNPGVQLVFHILDLPFILAAILLGSSQLSLNIGRSFGKTKQIFIICSSLGLVLLLLSLYFNFALPDAPLFT